MSKILKNQTSPSVDIIISETGVTLLAGQSYTIDPTNYLYWAKPETISELTANINSGNIVVNDGLRDLSVSEGLRHLKYADEAFNQRFLSNPDRNNGFTSRNTQEAIEEAKITAPGTAGPYAAISGFDGNATTGRWLEFLTNIASNVSGHVIPEAASIKYLSVAAQTNTTCTFTIYKNGISLETLTLTAQRKNNKISLNHVLIALDELSVQVTSGNCAKPTFNIFIKVTQ